MIELATTLGIDEAETKKFQEILGLFNNRDWQLLAPIEDALKMSASRILTKKPLPPTIFLFGDRDHLKVPQEAFIKRARELGQQFEMKIHKGGGHSFMMQPAFQEPSTQDVQEFLEKLRLLPVASS